MIKPEYPKKKQSIPIELNLYTRTLAHIPFEKEAVHLITSNDGDDDGCDWVNVKLCGNVLSCTVTKMVFKTETNKQSK